MKPEDTVVPGKSIPGDIPALPGGGTNLYTVQGEIARGGMGSILLAEDHKFQRIVAMKVMVWDPDASDEQKQRFTREATVLAHLAHPNIVPVYDTGVDEKGQRFYTMKMVKGRTLQSIISSLAREDARTQREYSLDSLLNVFRKVCDAMAFAHDRGIIHRDLKPENIMVGEFGEVLVMDWGLAKVLSDTEDALPTTLVPGHPESNIARPETRRHSTAPEAPDTTLEGAVLGTPQYMSPEQAQGRVMEMDVRSDIYALGGILYAILALRPPVDGKALDEVLEKVSRGEITPLTQGTTTLLSSRVGRQVCRPSLIPPALAAVAMKALSLDRLKRYPNVEALVAEIDAFQRGFATRAEQAGFAKQVMLLVKRHQGIFSTAAAAWLLITALAIWFVIRIAASEREATRNAEVASENERQANRNADLATKNALEAKAEAKRASAAEELAIRKEEDTRLALSQAQLALAETAYRDQDGSAMLKLLEAVPEDLRDSNWSYLLNKADSTLAHISRKAGQYVVNVAAISPQPGVFALLGDDGWVSIVEAKTGGRLMEYPSGLVKAFGIAVSSGGEKIAVGGSDHISLLATNDGSRLGELEAKGKVHTLMFSPDGKRLLGSSEAPSSLSLWDVGSKQLLWTKSGFSKAVFDQSAETIIFYSPKGRQLQFLDALSGHLVQRERPLPSAMREVTAMALARNGDCLLTGDAKGFVRCVNLRDGSISYETRANDRKINDVAFIEGGDRFVTAADLSSGEESLQVWETASGRVLQHLLGSRSGGNPKFGTHPHSTEVLLCGLWSAKVWDTPAHPEKWKLSMTGNSKDQRSGAFWISDDFIFGQNRFQANSSKADLLKLETDRPNSRITLWKAGSRGYRFVSVGGDAPLALVADPQKESTEIQVLVKAGQEIEAMNPRSIPGQIGFMHLSPSGHQVMVKYRGQGGGDMSILDPMSGAVLVKQLERDGLRFTLDAAWVAGGLRVAAIATSGAERGTPSSKEQIVLWDAQTGKRLRSEIHPTLMNALAASPAGETLAEAGADCVVRIRDSETLQIRDKFRAHDAPIQALAWHPSRQVLATASDDLTIKIWDLDTGRLIDELTGLTGSPLRLYFSPTGKRIACVADDNMERIWELDLTSPGAEAGGWVDLLGQLKRRDVESANAGWGLNGGALVSLGAKDQALPLPGNLVRASYQLQLKLRDFNLKKPDLQKSNSKSGLAIILPVAERTVTLMIDGIYNKQFTTRLWNVQEPPGQPESVNGAQIQDSEFHEVEITVSLEGEDVRIVALLDEQPLLAWKGPVSALSPGTRLGEFPQGVLGLGARRANWVVSAIKVKRL